MPGNILSIGVFLLFVLFVLGLSFYLARRSTSASGYFAAGGQVHWAVNGIAFAGDYLSAASFLGICGMIATLGYDGFLYSIGYLAGWVVALFVVAEPMKRLGKYTFTDALDSKFNSKGIQLAAGISTLVVSVFYLIPQMVGAGVLVTPLLGLPHAAGVVMVGAIVISIVATAGMTSTTYVQFLKGAMLVVFSSVVVTAVCVRGLTTTPDQGGSVPYYEYKHVAATMAGDTVVPSDAAYRVVSSYTDAKSGKSFVKMERDGVEGWWKKDQVEGAVTLHEVQYVAVKVSGEKIVNGVPAASGSKLRQVGNLTQIEGKTGEEAKTGSVGPIGLLAIIGNEGTKVNLWKEMKFDDGQDKIAVYYPQETPGKRVLRPGLKFKLEGTPLERMDFVSLMLALFLGTAALPHILIRYYTVPSPACARKSTIVAIAVIGFFYVLTLFMGLGAMTGTVVNPLDNNMSAPLLARSFGELLFAVISAIAFATVLGTVAGLIVAASGAVAHDLVDRFGGAQLEDKRKVRIGKMAAVAVGIVAIFFGIIFQGVNVTFLVGLAFAVAASANLPSILMLLFWKRTTAAGVVASIFAGIVASVGFILLSPTLYALYGLDKATAPIQMENPAIFSVPISFLVLVVVSLITQKPGAATGTAKAA